MVFFVLDLIFDISTAGLYSCIIRQHAGDTTVSRCRLRHANITSSKMIATTRVAAMPLIIFLCFSLFRPGKAFAFPLRQAVTLRTRGSAPAGEQISWHHRARHGSGDDRRMASSTGKLRMSEMPEDYPSDTGDDRFSEVGASSYGTTGRFT